MTAKKSIFGSSVLVMAVMLSSKLLGSLRQFAIASTYGANTNTDIYFLSSDFMLGLSGALIASLTTALLTIYIDISIKKSKNDANAVASKMLTLFLLASVILIALINLFAPWIAKMLAPSYVSYDLRKLILYLRIFSIAFIFSAFQSIYAAVLNANDSFVPGKLYGILYNPIAIFLVLAFGKKLGIGALVIAYFMGNILQTLLLRHLCRNTFNFKPSVNFRDENIKQLIMLSLPLLVSNIFIQLNNIVDKAICSILGEGFASYYSYSYTLEQFVTATLTLTVSLILLSRYATYVSEKNTKMVIKTFKESLGWMIILLAPITAIAIAQAEEIVKIVYMRGEFNEIAAHYTAYGLIGFLAGLVPVAVREMYIRLHFSYQDTKTPLRANIAAVILNAALSIILSRFMGIVGITLSTSVSVLLTVYILNRSVKKYIPDFCLSSISGLFIKVLFASILAFLVSFGLKNILSFNIILNFMISSVVALTIYVLLLLAMKCTELYELFNNAKTKVVNKLQK